MIIVDSYVSISDIRDKTTSTIKSLNKVGTKIILSQNKPVGVFKYRYLNFKSLSDVLEFKIIY